MTKYKGVNGFGNSAGDSTTTHVTKYKGRGVFGGKSMSYSSASADISGSGRHYAKAKMGTGGGSPTHMRGKNAFSRGRK